MPDAGGKGIDALVWLGIAVSLGLIVISALVSARMSYRSADTELDGWIYAIGAALIECLKAIVPFMMAWSMMNRDWIATVGGALVFILATAFSFTNGLGFASELRAFREGGRTAAIETRSGIVAEIKRLEANRDSKTPTRGQQELEEGIRALLSRQVADRATVGSVSNDCAKARIITKDACLEVGKLRVELAIALEKRDLDRQIEELRQKLSLSQGDAVMRTAEPQLEAVRGLGKLVQQGWNDEQVRLALAVVVGLVFEVGSGLGLYVVTSPWRRRPTGTVPPKIDADPLPSAVEAAGNREGQQPEREENMTDIVDNAVCIGSVDAFADACLMPLEGSRISSSALFQAYGAWCRERGEVPYREAEFVVMMQDLAQEVGIEASYRGGNLGFRDIQFVTPDGSEAPKSAIST